MNAIPLRRHTSRQHPMVAIPAELEATLDAFAMEDDRVDGAPLDALKYLVRCGASTAVLPASLGGAEFGWSPGASRSLCEWLRRLGASHLSVARLYEGHVNAFQLIWTCGDAAQREALCRYVAEGGWLGVWNAPHPSGPLALHDAHVGYVLDGSKAYASGAGLINRPLVTAQHARLGYVMVWPSTGCEVGARSEWEMHGMRASVTLPVHYRGAHVDASEIIGADNAYHSEPQFTAGAWRFLAAQLGAGQRLGQLASSALVRAGRDGDAHQRARMADIAIALETAAMWVEHARRAADGGGECTQVIHVVRMARLAVEQQLLAVMQWVHRSVGLSAFRRDHPIERITRDLETYLRQPVPDLVRDKVGEHMLASAVRA
ncbi:acyl-CoA dehydrogenase family protein [Dyella japonica]|uniref:Alkylation response protein AidB-like acyl-CoA dehydrogenase n=1 Tax=Dyella japonica TaxID=231455 RepID=A0ABV2JWR4_9GAMM